MCVELLERREQIHTGFKLNIADVRIRNQRGNSITCLLHELDIVRVHYIVQRQPNVGVDVRCLSRFPLLPVALDKLDATRHQFHWSQALSFGSVPLRALVRLLRRAVNAGRHFDCASSPSRVQWLLPWLHFLPCVASGFLCEGHEVLRRSAVAVMAAAMMRMAMSVAVAMLRLNVLVYLLSHP